MLNVKNVLTRRNIKHIYFCIFQYSTIDAYTYNEAQQYFSTIKSLLSTPLTYNKLINTYIATRFKLK
jgi:hypothetical protein